MTKEVHNDFEKKGSSFCEMKFIRLTDVKMLIGKPIFSNISIKYEGVFEVSKSITTKINIKEPGI